MALTGDAVDGVIESIVYRNEDNGFTVMELSNGRETFTAVGSVAFIQTGEQVRLWGEWVEHPDYGRQLKVSRFESVLPATTEGIVRYLASGQITGVGLHTAQMIVNTFGEHTLEIMQFSPDRLMEVPGIGQVKCEQITESFRENWQARSVLVFLQSYGVSALFAQRIYKLYGSTAVERIRQNPYRLVEDVEGIGFQSADKIAQSMGIAPDSPFRVEAGIKFVLSTQASDSGHVFLPADALAERTAELLNVDLTLTENALAQLAIHEQIVLENVGDETAAYLPPLHRAEENTAHKLWMLCGGDAESLMSDEELALAIDGFEEENGLSFDEKQREAIRLCMQNGLCVITGGPGTGKTTIIRCIVSLMQQCGLSVALAAPTGRAAKRMNEATGQDASTLHRLLEYGQTSANGPMFQRNEEYPLDEDVLIVDESSMMDIALAYRVLQALAPGARLVLVGDADQLPSVGPGNFLRDILACDRIPSVSLTAIYRQDEKSMIVVNAHRINDGEEPVFNQPDGGFYIDRSGTAADAAKIVVALNQTRLPKRYGWDPIRQIQVLTPMRKGVAGTGVLNAQLQAALNPPIPGKNERRVGDSVLREGDKVMQIKNNYQLEWVRRGQDGTQFGTGVFNGDIGELFSLNDEEQTAAVRFDDERVAVYEYSQLDELELAYALSVHKSQGSEFPAVILPLVASTPLLMTRNLLYTAVTRAKELVVIVGKDYIVAGMIRNNRITQRYSGLQFRLHRYFEEIEHGWA